MSKETVKLVSVIDVLDEELERVKNVDGNSYQSWEVQRIWEGVHYGLQHLNEETKSVVGFPFYPSIKPVERKGSAQGKTSVEVLRTALMNALFAVLALNKSFVVKEWRSRSRNSCEAHSYINAIDRASLAIQNAIDHLDSEQDG